MDGIVQGAAEPGRDDYEGVVSNALPGSSLLRSQAQGSFAALVSPRVLSRAGRYRPRPIAGGGGLRLDHADRSFGPQDAAPSCQGEAHHLPLHGWGPEPPRTVRLQTAARQ